MVPHGSRSPLFADIARLLLALAIWLVKTLVDLVVTAVMSPSSVPLRRLVVLVMLVVVVLGVTQTVPIDWNVITQMPTVPVR